MADDNLRIVIAVDPTEAARGTDAVAKQLTSLEKTAAKAGESISKSVGDGMAAAAKGSERAAAAAASNTARGLQAVARAAREADSDVASLRAELAGLSAKGAVRNVRETSGDVASLRAELAKASGLQQVNAKGFAPRGATPAANAAKEIEATISGFNRMAHEARGAASMFTEMDTQTRSLTSSLRALAPAVGAVVIAKGVVDISDAYVNLRNKLAVVTDSTEELDAVQRRLYEQSQENRVAFEGTAALYSRLAANTAELGINQEQLLSFTDSLGKAVKISGASANEANAAMIQLSQGLASGTLRGDELRSVLEQLPTVADVIAKGLGVTRGKLREMGFEGKITSKAIIESFQKAEGELNDKFGKTVPTVGDAVTKLRNTLIQFAGDLQPVMGPLVDVMIKLVDVLGRVLGALGPVIAGVGKLASVAASAVGTVADAVTAVSEGVTESFGQLADDIDSLGGRVSEFDGDLQEFERRNMLAANAIRGVADETNLFGDVLLTEAEKLYKSNRAKEEARRANLSLAESILDPEARLLLFIERGQQADEMFKKLAATINQTVVDGAVTTFNRAIDRAVEALKKYRDEMEAVVAAADPAAAATARLSDQQETLAQAVRAGDLTADQAAAMYATLAAAAEATIDPLASLERRLADETAELRFGLKAKEADIRLRKEIIALEAAGIVVTDEQEASLRAQIEALVEVEKKRTSAGKASSNAAKDFARELRAVMDAAFPAAAAARALAEQHKILAKATEKYPARADEFAAAAERLSAAARDQIDPLGAVTRELEREIDAMTQLTAAHVRHRDILADLDASGAETTARQRDELYSTLRFIELYQEAEKRAADAAEDRRGLAADAAAAVDAEWQRRAERFAEAAESAAAWEAELANSLKGGLVAGAQEAGRELIDLNTLVKQSFGSAVASLEDALVDSIMRAGVDWGRLADQMLADIVRIAARMALLSAIGGFGGSGFNVKAGQDVLKGILPGFRDGGTFTVPGAGAPDSRVAAFRVSPRERVTIETQRQQRDADRAARAGRAGAAGPVSVSTTVIYDPRAAVRAVNTSEGRRHLVEAVRADPRAFAATLRR